MNTKYLFSSLTAISIVSFSPITRAQTYQPTNRIPVADNSRIGTQVVETTNKNFTITGGVNLGQNLLHSFSDFSVPTGGAATFDNSSGKQSIITRVTGGNFSDINGLVNTQGANFFLLNPNGIVFGTNAQLNVGQTFVGSTANGIDLVDGGGNTVNFLTNQSKDSQLLTINPNALFNASRLNMGGGNGQITNFGTLQTTNPNQYIGLIGGNVSMNGGQINAPGGRIELGGLSAAGTVALGVDGNNLRAIFPTNVVRGDVSLTNQAGVNVAGAGAGDIAISAKNLEILGDSFVIGGIFSGFGTPESVAGDIKVNAAGDLVLSGSNSRIVNQVGLNSKGQSGNITIEAGSFDLREGALLQSSTFGQGNAGNVSVKAKDAISIAGTTDSRVVPVGIFSTVESGSVGKGGDINITAASLSLRDGVQLATITREADINANKPAGRGDAGNVTVKVTGAVNMTGSKNEFPTGISSYVDTGTVGNGGNITINTSSISLGNYAVIGAATGGQGEAGSVIVNASDFVSIVGRSGLLVTSTSPTGNAGDIVVTSPKITLILAP
jgi:filamentous hemagglutinin family protein